MRPPKPLSTNRQHPAVDHVEKFLEEEFVLGKGHVNIGAFARAYDLWCEVRGVVNRKLGPVLLLDYIETKHGIRARSCYTGTGSVFALSGIAFKTDGLNDRLRRAKGRTAGIDMGALKAKAWDLNSAEDDSEDIE